MALKTKKEKSTIAKPIHQSKSFAVIETGGKQYLIKPGDVIRIERIEKPKKGDTVYFEKVLLLVKEGEIKLGNPYLKTVKIGGKLLKEGRFKKITHLRYHSKTRQQRRKGHRQIYSEVKIGEF
ncbi:MAG: 50S ribosomal protein L21 [Candidatus Tagabacteria bacterium CG_4_10_14_0_2_um_filter_40_13]|uniref:Large ribosomal subunit protein bL21 n=1 Tax=Candidatus Tagabacteria bacterium CG_4_9_14_0_2_um_filter_41_11 TaxID=1975019 RepID=A0A2M8ER72_9BACT|nr:MAG: 50S ribosomal protein L21 [Candidatus Tagabacteria bacterium CG11_big_fil_rev_8_21_14_0_20_41_11]PIZ56042.1 MAG: 50S ribosomal protein L21 [Candidatus Tagabacteria bacterium CG_4_10_14_0_2_um_filter_40_13]PJC25229.1 MAG: 50S ribosomal protein L21 [Candidatus Tagabacteria bacterium CG_4_9_14_0_2_um_filter_41_11]